MPSTETYVTGTAEHASHPKALRFLAILALLLPLCFSTGCHVLHADPQVAFLGDSLTQGWYYPTSNFGVFGNTTAQILARSQTILAQHHYNKVVVLGGTNDVLLKVDPQVTLNNLETLGLRIQQTGAEPILCEIPPIFHHYVQSDHTDFSPQVRALNRQIPQLAARHGWKLVDYYDPLLDHPAYSSDGVHMKKLGYLTMERALLKVVPDA